MYKCKCLTLLVYITMASTERVITHLRPLNDITHDHMGNSIKCDYNVLSCLTKYSDHDSIKNIKKLMQSVNTSAAFNFHNIDVNVVRAHLNKLKCNKATGYDILPARLLKIGCDILCYYLAPGGGCEVLFSPVCLSVCLCVCVFVCVSGQYFGILFLLHRSKVNVTGTVHCFLKVQSYHKN